MSSANSTSIDGATMLILGLFLIVTVKASGGDHDLLFELRFVLFILDFALNHCRLIYSSSVCFSSQEPSLFRPLSQHA